MKDFIAIDFETANHQRTSICSIGIVIVQNGRITDHIHEYVRPTPNFYHWANTRVHGMTEADTKNAPLFPQVWEKIHPRVKDYLFVAHNVSFDENCLKSTFAHYDLPYPHYPFFCTCQASKKYFKHLENHKLPTVATHCGFNLTRHHEALADAEACAHIALKLFSQKN